MTIGDLVGIYVACTFVVVLPVAFGLARTRRRAVIWSCLWPILAPVWLIIAGVGELVNVIARRGPHA